VRTPLRPLRFLPAEAKELVATPQRTLHDLAHEQLHFIAEYVAVVIVDRI
jgi:hypothetical protein